MEFDRLIGLRRGGSAAIAAAIAALEIAGCSHSGSDPNAAPYGASASPSPSVATLNGPDVSSAQPAGASPAASPSADLPPDPVGPDTKVPAKWPHSALPGGDKGSDVTAPPMSEPSVSSNGPAGAGGPASGPGGPAGGGPMMGAMGSSPTAPLTPTPEMDAKIAAAEKSGKKKDIGTAYALRGTFRMNDPDAGARVKYRAALDDYRKALAADPTNEEAKHNKDLIEGIYKQMGRPIPGA